MNFPMREKALETIRAREAELRAQGFTMLDVLSCFDPATGDHRLGSWFGETERLVLTDCKIDDALGMTIPFGPTSKVIECDDYHDAVKFARELDGITVVVFKGSRPK